MLCFAFAGSEDRFREGSRWDRRGRFGRVDLWRTGREPPKRSRARSDGIDGSRRSDIRCFERSAGSLEAFIFVRRPVPGLGGGLVRLEPTAPAVGY